MIEDSYYDDPIDEEYVEPRRKISKIAIALALILGGGLFIQNTLAANVSITSSGPIEFGQGFAQQTTCAGSPVTLNISMGSSFVNSSLGGTHLFKTIRVDNVPVGCQGVDFSFSTYGNSSSTPDPMFDSATIAATTATIYMSSANKFYPVNSGDMTVVTNSSSSFTISLDMPSGPSSAVSKLTLESASHDTNEGITWQTTNTVPASSSWNWITYGNGKFVAVGTDSSTAVGQAMYSTDGINWTLGTGVPNRSWSNVTYGNGKFVAVASGYVMYSNNGIAWSAAATSLTGMISSGVVYGKDKFVISYYNGYYYSTDGSNWTQVNLGLTRSLLYYANNQFMALGSLSNGLISADGINWTTLSDSNLSNTAVQGLAYGTGIWIATSQAGVPHSLYSTNNGASWSSISMPTEPYGGFAYGNGLFVGVGNAAINHAPQGIYGTDGTSWTTASGLPTGSWTSLVYGNGKFVAVATTGQVMYSD